MTSNIFCFYLQNRLIQISQTGGQWYSDTSPFSIPWLEIRCEGLFTRLVSEADFPLSWSVFQNNIFVLVDIKRTGLSANEPLNSDRRRWKVERRGTENRTGENLKVVCAEFSTLS
jgi:hypothetical protein